MSDCIELSEKYRWNNTFEFEVEEKRQKCVLESLCNTLSDYTTMGSLENAIRALVQTKVSLKKEFLIIDASQTMMKGRSNNSVFFVSDRSGTVHYVVKAFPNACLHPSEYLAEVSALNMIASLSLLGVDPIKTLGYGIYRENNNNWGLLLETAAKGKRVDEYLYPLIGSEPCLGVFQNTIELAKKAFSCMGKSLAQLHGNHEIYGPVPDWCLKRYEERLEKIQTDEFIRKRLLNVISISEFTATVSQIKEQIHLLSIPYTYWHGDAHFGNMFYFEEDDSFCFIDAARMHMSIDYEGKPTMDGTLDLMRIEENLKILRVEGLSENVAEGLLTAFYQSYFGEIKRVPNQKLLNFYRVFMLMGRLIIYSKCDQEVDFSKETIINCAFESALSEFASILGCKTQLAL